jgi:hypothetical protein
MVRAVLITVTGIACIIGLAAALQAAADGCNDIPGKDTPRKLQESWLRFHGSDLCQDLDAVFVFDGGGMQIWSRIDSDKAYLKFQDIFGALSTQYRVTLYTNRTKEEKEWDNGDNPPPSLWQNYELRANLGDRAAQFPNFGEERITINPPSADPLLKQRLYIYADQTLKRNKKMTRIALGIFALVRLATDPDIPGDIRSKAAAIGSDHAKSLDKQIGKLTSDLKQAIPRSGRRRSGSSKSAISEFENMPLRERAEQIYERTQSVALAVHRFIFPELYTVALSELRDPSLTDSLNQLRGEVQSFQKDLAKSDWKRAK